MSGLLRRVSHDLRRAIRRGEFPPGSVLPDKASLAARFGCSPITVNRALGELASAGVVRRVRRKGTLVPEQTTTCAGRICLLQAADMHTNGLLVEPIDTALHAAGYQVDIVPLSADLDLTWERCAHLAGDEAVADAIVSLYLPGDEPTDAEGRLGEVLSCFPARLLVAPTAAAPDPRYADTHWLGIDHGRLARCVIEHLLALGHRRIAVDAGLSPDEVSGPHTAAEFCRHLVESGGGEFTPVYFGGGYRSRLPELFRERRITAYWTITDHDAILVTNDLYRAGWLVPGDISIVGRNDTPWCRQTDPALTSTSWNPGKLAETAVQLVTRLIRERSEGIPPWITIDPSLVVRRSTAQAAPV